MAVSSSGMPVASLIETLQGIDGGEELPIKIASYEGDHGMAVYSVRKHVVMNEENEVVDAYVVING